MKSFIEEKVREIREIVGEGRAIIALSGGVDSSTAAMLAYKAIGETSRCFCEHRPFEEGRTGIRCKDF